MSESILVAYATRYGSTQQVAEAVAAELREGGLVVDVQPVSQVRALARYGPVVLGAPLYIGSLLKDARRFLTRHGQALAQRPVAVFALGPIGSAADEAGWQAARAMLDGELEKFPGLVPVAVELFGGKYDPARVVYTSRWKFGAERTPL